MKIAIIGDYDKNRPSHVATYEAIQKTATSLSKKLFVQWIPTQSLEVDDKLALLQEFDGVWGAPGDPKSSLGVINAVQFSREKDIPYLGT
jgi:CTP synthase (UTP-ammonia lyase)